MLLAGTADNRKSERLEQLRQPTRATRVRWNHPPTWQQGVNNGTSYNTLEEQPVRKPRQGRGVSGNPARRAADGEVARRVQMAAELWPFAFDYYAKSHRVMIFADVPVITTQAGAAVDLHGTEIVPIEGLDRLGVESLAVVGTVRAPDGPDMQVMCSRARGFDPALTEVLTDITSMFMAELGPAAERYVQTALQDRPMLGSPRTARDVLLPLIVRENPSHGVDRDE